MAKCICVFLHGFPDDPEIWKAQVDYLQKNFPQVQILNLNLYELSIDLKKARSRSETLALIQKKLSAIHYNTEIDHLIFICHDLGVPYASYAAKRIGKHTSLVIANGLTPEALLKKNKNPRQFLKSWYIYFFQTPLFPEKLLLWAPQILKKSLLRHGHTPTADPRAHRAPLIYKQLLKEALWEPDVFYKSSIRSYVAWGIEDPFLESPTQSDFEDLTTDTDIYLFPSGHWIQKQNPEDFNKILKKALDT